jgi:p-cumate 2,3-dioxygenase beta subunit
LIAWNVTRGEIEDFLYREAALLDDWKLDEWATLFTDDAHYVVPSNDFPAADPTRHLVMIDDNKQRLLARVERLNSRHAHREFPHSRTRHQVMNVISEGGDEQGLRVSASFIVWRFRNDRADFYVGRYDYVLAAAETGGFRIRYKRATLDMPSLEAAGTVSIIL